MELKEQETTELKQEEMEQAPGGTLWPNVYNEDTYHEVGIKVESHLLDRDEFWWNGRDIGHDNANSIVIFYKVNGRLPASLEEATQFRKDYFA